MILGGISQFFPIGLSVHPREENTGCEKSPLNSRDSQSIIVGCYVIIFGAGQFNAELVPAEDAMLIGLMPSDYAPRVPDSPLRVQMGTFPLQFPWSRHL